VYHYTSFFATFPDQSVDGIHFYTTHPILTAHQTNNLRPSPAGGALPISLDLVSITADTLLLEGNDEEVLICSE
jgi:hypothetical protein